MPLYRRDRIEINEHKQEVAYTDWMGGPDLAAIGGAICDDGQRRNAYITGEPNTSFSVPAYVNNGKNGRVKGYISANDEGAYTFNAYYVDEKPYKWLPVSRPIPSLTTHR
jgi:hypothetical protein